MFFELTNQIKDFEKQYNKYIPFKKTTCFLESHPNGNNLFYSWGAVWSRN